MARAMAAYNKRRVPFLAAHPVCPVLLALQGVTRATETIHHTRGRAGALLLDERFWLAVSMEGHRWIEDNKAEAKRRGWTLPGGGAWNCYPPGE